MGTNFLMVKQHLLSMNSFTITKNESKSHVKATSISSLLSKNAELLICLFAFFGAIVATYISFTHGWILAYGDAESHINISKNVIDSLTPGFAQLGGIWLPLTHLMMVPLVYFNPLWKTGLAGSIISGIFYIITCVYIFKITMKLTGNLFASVAAFIIFATNVNILYMQTTPMTEIPLIAFFVLSTYYFIEYQYNPASIPNLLFTGFFALCASLTRYDGWFLVLFESLCILIPGLLNNKKYAKSKADTILFTTLAAFGIVGWFIWNWLIFGNPLYFDNSIYSAQSQQLVWLQKGELPGYHNLLVSLIYYIYTCIGNSGYIIFFIGFIGAIVFAGKKKNIAIPAILTIFLVPFIFNVLSLFLGQSVIFIPDLTPSYYDFHLFNVRYGIMMIPFLAVFSGYLICRVRLSVKILLVLCILLQSLLFYTGISPVITLADGTNGLSAQSYSRDAENYVNDHYSGGYILFDRYARTISIIHSNIPMNNFIYVGNKPYWDISLKQPEKYVTWIVMQKNDALWNSLYENPSGRLALHKYFTVVYKTGSILIYHKI